MSTSRKRRPLLITGVALAALAVVAGGFLQSETSNSDKPNSTQHPAEGAVVSANRKRRRPFLIAGTVFAALAIIASVSYYTYYRATFVVTVEQDRVAAVFDDSGKIIEILEPGEHFVEPGTQFHIYDDASAYDMSHFSLRSRDGQFNVLLSIRVTPDLRTAVDYINAHREDTIIQHFLKSGYPLRWIAAENFIRNGEYEQALVVNMDSNYDVVLNQRIVEPGQLLLQCGAISIVFADDGGLDDFRAKFQETLGLLDFNMDVTALYGTNRGSEVIGC